MSDCSQLDDEIQIDKRLFGFLSEQNKNAAETIQITARKIQSMEFYFARSFPLNNPLTGRRNNGRNNRNNGNF